MAKKTLVLIDDDKWLVDLYGERLRLADYEVITASSGKEGYDLIVKHRPDIVLSDVVMSNGDGFYLLKKVRSNPEISNMIVINLTNLSSGQDHEELEKLGSDGFLVKAEYTPTQAVDKIRQILNNLEKNAAKAKK